VLLAIDEADVILFVCEVETGITDYVSQIANMLRRCGKPVVLAVK
jgi:GTP-binding protein